MDWITNPGFLVFGTIKFVGYCALLYWIMHGSPILAGAAGLVRALLGLVTGIGLMSVSGGNGYVFYALVLVARWIEWALVLKVFYGARTQLGLRATMATAGSVVLDLPAAFGWIALNGIVC